MKAIAGVLLLVPALTCAGDIIESSVTLEDKLYVIDVKARIHASPERVFRFITDYERLPSLNASIRESSIIHTWSPARHRVRTVIRACVLFFCRSVLQVQDIEQVSDTQVTARIIPELSDFRYGRAKWVLDGSGQETTMHFTAGMEPAFWVPPVIGPWLFKRKIVSELLESAAYMETDATGPATP
jgi:hypothetical protein